MWVFFKNSILLFAFSLLAEQVCAQQVGRLELKIKDLQQVSSPLLGTNIWSLAEPASLSDLGILPRDFIGNRNFLPGTNSMILALTIRLDEPAELSLQIPEFPFYELSLGERVLVRQGEFPDHPQRLYRTIHLGFSQEFPLRLKLTRNQDYWNPYTPFLLGLSEVIQRNQQMEELYGAFFLGLVIITALYHFCFSIIIPRNHASLFFGFFISCLALRASLTGTSQILVRIFPLMSWEWSWKLGFIGYFLAVPANLSFLIALYPGTISKTVVKTIWAPALFMVILTLLTRVNTYAHWCDYFHIVTLFTVGSGVFCFVRAYRLKLPTVEYSIASVGILTLATANDIASVMGLLPTRSFLDLAIIAFIFSQTAIISFYYGKSFRDIYHIHTQLRKLIYKHVISRIAHGRHLEETMPIGCKEAVVLGFDVVASSTIKHEKFDATLERVMAKCQEILHEQYDEEKIAARGYRIKEMGDGLLCSVGFPFLNLSQDSDTDTAIKIAERFCIVFAEEMAQLNYHENMYCAIGIAQGVIEGFFPKSGICQYDIRGRPLIMATRYESMRNVVFKKTGVKSSLIFIQDAVYQNLSSELKALFTRWDCSEKGNRIRDDAYATQAWYRRMPGTSIE